MDRDDMFRALYPNDATYETFVRGVNYAVGVADAIMCDYDGIANRIAFNLNTCAAPQSSYKDGFCSYIDSDDDEGDDEFWHDLMWVVSGAVKFVIDSSDKCSTEDVYNLLQALETIAKFLRTPEDSTPSIFIIKLSDLLGSDATMR